MSLTYQERLAAITSPLAAGQQLEINHTGSGEAFINGPLGRQADA